MAQLTYARFDTPCNLMTDEELEDNIEFLNGLAEDIRRRMYAIHLEQLRRGDNENSDLLAIRESELYDDPIMQVPDDAPTQLVISDDEDDFQVYHNSQGQLVYELNDA